MRACRDEGERERRATKRRPAALNQTSSGAQRNRKFADSPPEEAGFEVQVSSQNSIVCAPAATMQAIFAKIDNSLHRLGLDYVDLYQIHRFDHDTPIEETLEAVHDVIETGKARHIGASSMHAWQFARALGIAEKKGGRASSVCRTSSTCSIARRSTKCCRYARPRVSASSPGARRRAAN